MHNSEFDPLSVEEIQQACQLKSNDETTERVCRINEEITQGLELISQYPKKVSFFGSARFDENHPEYKKARSLGVINNVR